MAERLNPKDCPICSGDGEHKTFAGKPCPLGKPQVVQAGKEISKEEQRQREIKWLERLWSLRPSVRI